MFALRNDLFDLWSSSGISFQHPAYKLIRTTINGFIRFGHKFSFMQIFILNKMCNYHASKLDSETSFNEEWASAISTLDPAMTQKMESIRSHMNMLLLVHLVRSSPLFIVLVLTWLPGNLISRFFAWTAKAFATSWKRRVIDKADSAAFAYGDSIQHAEVSGF